MSETSKSVAVFDTECTHDYWMCYFKDIDTGNKKYFEIFDGHPLDRAGFIRILHNFTLVSYNGITYDIPMIKAALRQNVKNDFLKKINDAIINQRMKPWDVCRKFALPEIPWIDHIDIIEPAPSVNVSLKLYGGRLHSRKLQDLPFDPDELMFEGDPNKRDTTIGYCENDLDTTIDLYRHIEPQINLRSEMSKQYGVDLRSKSDAQIAEAVIKHEIERITGDAVFKPTFQPDYSFKYEPPAFLKFRTQQMQEVFETVCAATFKLKKKEVREEVDEDGEPGEVKIKISGIEMPKEIKALRVKMGESVYRMGIGGLHSSEKAVARHSDEDDVLVDSDVASYYPAILLVCGLYPLHLGRTFLDVYRGIRERRIEAKHNKDKVTDMTLKIVLNGTFGKLGSKYSFLYSPNLMIQVTITGQLALLMLIEALEAAGISVVSANTDGIVSRCPRHLMKRMVEVTQEWERNTGFDMEQAIYRSLYSASVNSYLAVKASYEEEKLAYEAFPFLKGEIDRGVEFKSGVKQKGLYSFVGSKGSPAEKNPKNYVCIDALINYLTKGTPFIDTIEWCPDVRRFLTVQRVTGGAEYEGRYLGKVVRFYRSTNSNSPILYATGDKKGDKVPKSDCSMPLMELDGTLPDDIDYEYYVAECNKMLGAIGVL